MVKDRNGQGYLVVTRAVKVHRALVNGGSSTEARQVPCWVLSPTRQAEKLLGLSGRQLRKWRKEQRRNAVARHCEASVVHGDCVREWGGKDCSHFSKRFDPDYDDGNPHPYGDFRNIGHIPGTLPGMLKIP